MGNSDIINKKNTNHIVLTILHTGFIYKYPLLLFFIFYFIYYSSFIIITLGPSKSSQNFSLIFYQRAKKDIFFSLNSLQNENNNNDNINNRISPWRV